MRVSCTAGSSSSTGRSTIQAETRFPIAPLLKVSTSSEVFRMMEDDIDLDAGRAAGGATTEAVGADLVSLLQRVARGEPTKAEAAGYDLMAVYTQGPAF